MLKMISNMQYQRIQGIWGDQSFSVVLPKHYAVSLGISKGEYVKVAIEGNRIVIERDGLMRERSDKQSADR